MNQGLMNLNVIELGGGIAAPMVGKLLADLGATVDENSGLIEWTPSTAQIGIHFITVAAVDDSGALSTQPRPAAAGISVMATKKDEVNATVTANANGR